VGFDKSLKLLNYAKNNSNNLELYTELDHSFIVGDKIFIIGGHYDNVNNLLFISDFSSLTPNTFNPFKSNSNGYKIISVNYTNNSFVINYPITNPTLIYPYGNTNNRFGNPQNLINLAYNTYSSDNLYKNIYVSRTCFLNGNFKKGTINNGVFGTDTNTIILNTLLGSANINHIIINHIVSKNVYIGKGIINSKTDVSNPITKKIKVIEDTTISINNPFTLIVVPTTNNNNGWGYSQYERFNHANNLIINNGDFDNPYNERIKLNTVVIINKARIGSLEPIIGNGTSTKDITLLSGVMHYVTNTGSGLTTVNNALYDTLIPLNLNDIIYTNTPGLISFNVNYNVLANKKWENGSNVYISGIETINDTFNDLNTNLTGTIINTSYTFGDINSANIQIQCASLIPIWPTLITTTLSDYNITNVKIGFINLSLDKLTINNSTIVGNFISLTNDIYFNINNNVTEGSLSGIIFNDTTQFNGSSIGNNIYINENNKQYVTGPTVPIMNYCFLNNTNNNLKGYINNSEIISGIIYDSVITNTVVIPTNIDTTIYLNNVRLGDGAKIDPGVIWNNVNIQFYGDTVTGTNINTLSYLSDRKTPWKTGLFGSTPLNISDYSLELNKTEAITGNEISYYTSQHRVQVDTVTVDAPIYKLAYQAPIIEGTIQLYNSTIRNIKSVILDNGPMTFSGVWNLNHIKQRVLFADKLIALSSFTEDNAIRNRFGNVNINTNVNFPGVALPPSNIGQIVNVDDARVIGNNNYIYPTEISTRRDITLHLHYIHKKSDKFPDSTMNDPLLKVFLKIIPSSGPIVDNIYHDIVTPTAIPNGLKYLNLRQLGIYESNGVVKTVSACFIEVEQVKIFETDLFNVPLATTVNYCNYCPPFLTYTNGKEYCWNLYPLVSQYPQDFTIKNINSQNVEFNITPTNKVQIHVEFWITWFYIDDGLNNMSENQFLKSTFKNGERTKHTIQHTFISSNETFNIINDSNDSLINNNGDNIVYI
jgi:hypothetical protein